MPKLIIDTIEVEVPAGTNLLEAARKVGVVVPHFCYHPALGNAGACRLCAVKLLDGPVKGMQMACMIPAQDGMVVSTTDGEAAEMRKHVIEWLMLNHPHDCPVCDEGGECLLQDYTIAGGHSRRRYTGKKRTHLNQDLGEQIKHEMNRCIQCYRCVRFYQEYAGGLDLGVMGSASRVYFGRFQEGQLESPFSGNLVDICPTGVYTDRTARYRARYWDYDMAPSVCCQCSLGCNTVPAARYRELLKTMARRNDVVNGWFICDKGRFNNGPVNSPDRPRVPKVDGTETGWQEAIQALVERIGVFQRDNGAGSVAILGSARLPHEASMVLPQLVKALGAGTLSYFAASADECTSRLAVTSITATNVVSMAEVQTSDCIVVTCDLLDEGPMLALAVRQAFRKGAKIVQLAGSLLSDDSVQLPYEYETVADLGVVQFADYKSPVVICGTKKNSNDVIRAAAGSGAKLAVVLAGPNAFGVTLLAEEHGAVALEEAVASGKVKAVVSFEADIPESLLASVTVLAAADWIPTPVVAQAGVFLPTTAHVEMDGTYINNEGRAQRFQKVMEPGVPIRGADPHQPPPREHQLLPPGGDLRETTQIAALLIERISGSAPGAQYTGRWQALTNIDPEGEGVRIL